MPTKSFAFLAAGVNFKPYLWGFAAAAALDQVIDIRGLFLPVLAAVAVVNGTLLVLRRTAG